MIRKRQPFLIAPTFFPNSLFRFLYIGFSFHVSLFLFMYLYRAYNSCIWAPVHPWLVGDISVLSWRKNSRLGFQHKYWVEALLCANTGTAQTLWKETIWVFQAKGNPAQTDGSKSCRRGIYPHSFHAPIYSQGCRRGSGLHTGCKPYTAHTEHCRDTSASSESGIAATRSDGFTLTVEQCRCTLRQ